MTFIVVAIVVVFANTLQVSSLVIRSIVFRCSSHSHSPLTRESKSKNQNIIAWWNMGFSVPIPIAIIYILSYISGKNSLSTFRTKSLRLRSHCSCHWHCHCHCHSHIHIHSLSFSVLYIMLLNRFLHILYIYATHISLQCGCGRFVWLVGCFFSFSIHTRSHLSKFYTYQKSFSEQKNDRLNVKK